MILSFFRSVGAVIVGLVVGFVLVVAIEVFSNALYPFPPELDPNDFEACKAFFAKYPTWVLAIGAAGWCLTVAVSTWLATRLGPGRHPAHGIVVGLLLCLAAAANILMLPYAVWFEIGCLVGLPLCVVGGVVVGKQPALSNANKLDG